MVSKEAKLRMAKFITDRLEESSRFNIQRSAQSSILIAQKPEIATDPNNPISIYIALHNCKMPLDEYKCLLRQNNAKGFYTANLFYKDGEMFMVRLGKRGHMKADDRSLKKYTPDQTNRMIHLRGLEKTVLDLQSPNSSLTYYQPETRYLTECLRGYSLDNVKFDYSHIKPTDLAYSHIKNTKSIDYKIADEQYQIYCGTLEFKGIQGKRMVHIKPSIV
jgi:hypothetical protein